MEYLEERAYAPENLLQRFKLVKTRHATRDVRMQQIKQIREGKLSEVAPSLFPEDGPWQEPIVANMIDIAARDMAELIAPLPAINCTSSTMVTQKAREQASKKTKIAQGYVAHSDLQVQMYSGADAYVTYGMLPIRVEPCYETNMPMIRILNPVGSYPEIDRFGRVQAFWQKVVVAADVLKIQYPEYASIIDQTTGPFGNSGTIELLFYHDKNWNNLVLMNTTSPVVLEKEPNELGKVLVTVVSRPGVTDVPRGQFDDVIFIQLAKSRFSLLALQAAHESVNSPLVVPNDVPEIPFGPGATIRTANPQSVRRVDLNVPREAFQEQAQLERELQLGSRFPSARTGNTDASIVTGQGVKALMDGYDTQVRGHQALFARALENVVELCFEMDVKLFGSIPKKIRTKSKGKQYIIDYNPIRDIGETYDVDVKYGLMAGLDPSRWLVFALQARAEKMFSRDFMRREMPIELDVEEESTKIDIEDMEDALKQAMMGYVQSIPAQAASGQDVTGPIKLIADMIEGRRKGKSLTDVASKAFAPPEPTPEELANQAAAQGQAPEESLPAGMTPDGRMQGVAPGQQGMAPGGRPALNMMLAGLDASGQPNITAAVSRTEAI